MPNISDIELQRLKQAVDELTSLNQIANAVNVSMRVDSITQSILDHCLKRVGAAQGAVFLLQQGDMNQAGDFKTFVREFTPEASGIPIRLNLSLTGWMVKNRAVLVCNSPMTDERFRGIDFTQLGITSLLAAPLMARTGLIGVLAIFNKKAEGGFSETDKRFLAIVGVQTAQVIENARLFEKEQQLRVVEEELKMAHSIQQGFLPKHSITSESVDIYGVNEPAKEVGGDFYDIFQVDAKRIFISVGDVSGKGMPASLLMANAQAVLRSQLSLGGEIDVAQMADRLNRLICQFARPGQFLTALFGMIDLNKGLFEFVNAGHNVPLIMARDGAVTTYDDADLLVGVLPDCPYRVQQIQLSGIQAVCLYSDGVTEANNEKEEMYGDERLHAIFSKLGSSNSKDWVEAIMADLAGYRGKQPPSDDITVLIARLH
ncbi:MAG: SpoIIE family protein phosphatase [candidate division Zixibacteria bacterium]|nr:SpoIIE family protein phosphatase [candidate division Zixibacteria bacterium]